MKNMKLSKLTINQVSAVMSGLAIISAIMVVIMFVVKIAESHKPTLYTIKHKGEIVHHNAQATDSHGVLYVTDENGTRHAYADQWQYHQINK